MKQQRHFLKFLPILKVDAEKREVHACFTSEALDSDGERCHYESTKPYYQKWSEACSKRSNGKSLGNVRAMHAKLAAGKVTRLEFDDEKQQVSGIIKVVDEAEWEKCKEGVYTGVSQGGVYVDLWEEDGEKWYTCSPVEVSLVDNPANPQAVIDSVKVAFSDAPYKGQFQFKGADGSIELRKFKEKPVAKKPKVKKSMYDVAALARLLCDIQYLQMSAAYEAEYEEDESAQPDMLKEWMRQGIEILMEMVDEEGAEMLAGKVAGKIQGGNMEKVLAPGELEIPVLKGKGASSHYKAMAAQHEKMAKAHQAMAEKCMKMSDNCSEDDEKKAAEPEVKKEAAPEKKEAEKAAAPSIEATLESFGEKLLTKVSETVDQKLEAFADALAGEPKAEAGDPKTAKTVEIDKGKAAKNESGREVTKEQDGGQAEKTNEKPVHSTVGGARDISKLRETLRNEGRPGLPQ